ncbi:MAG: hypothetical protein AABY15_04795 [Nanoarchaeota archaeon]
MEETKITPSWKYEDYEEYLRLKNEQEARVKEAKSDFNKLNVKIPEKVLDNVPNSKREEVINRVKMELVSLEIEKAKELLVKANSPLREKEIATLRINFANFYRNLIWNRGRLELLKAGTELTEGNRKVEKHEILFLIDKCRAELDLMRKELVLYGIGERELMEEIKSGFE